MNNIDTRASRFPQAFLLRLPEQVAMGMRRAADQGMTTQSEYARRAILKQLETDGVLRAESGATNV